MAKKIVEKIVRTPNSRFTNNNMGESAEAAKGRTAPMLPVSVTLGYLNSLSDKYLPDFTICRPPLVGPPPTMPGTMMAPVCTTGIPGAPVIPVVPSAYGLIGPQPTTYMQHPGFPQQNIPTQVPLVNTVPRPIPGMFVPVAPMNASLSRSNVDPAKLLEEQKRLEKERNFQLQQQRLKQFTIAGKTGSLNADNLIENIIGKVQPKTSSTTSNSSTKSSVSSEPVKPSKPVIETPQPFPLTIFKQDIPVNPPKPKKGNNLCDILFSN
ncbi:hypothetical protein AVEN_200009-1 [Araneus ventricosus]|uniref:Uncharacterized protein n=1 Tax=Araneus ventricosus TaxID=182803 RepID=A0A4Y2T119_ARAVE|nr:hypothetical protein AVEN_200009-1 [Araneus ventricosus]